MTEKRTENEEMSNAADVERAARLIQKVPYRDGMSVKELIWNAATKLGLTYEQAKTIWYGERRIIPAYLMVKLEKAQLEKARDERAILRGKLARLEAFLSTTDEEFHGPDIDALRDMGSGRSRLDLPGDEK